MVKRNSRSAKTGRYVTAAFARKHPSTTVSESRKNENEMKGIDQRSRMAKTEHERR